MQNRIYLIGFMGAGKTTIGKKLAERLNVGFLDTDGEFALRHGGVSTGEYISRFGLTAFRFEEQLTLKDIARRSGRFVVATGGGIPVAPGNMEVMKNSGLVVHLSVPLQVIAARMTADELAKRPVWTTKSKEELDTLYNERLTVYNQADLNVDAAGDAEKIVDEIAAQIKSCFPGEQNAENIVANAGVLPVISPYSLETALPMAKALVKGGLPLLEITLRKPWAIESIRKITEEVPEMLVGAGTVMSINQLDMALEAGAKFVVTPGFDPEIVTECLKRGVPIVPGCCTPTEITAAVKMGLKTLKFFPAELGGGCAALKLLHGPFPQCRFVATGGITLENMGKYLAHPFVMACGGSFCAPESLLANEKWEDITQLCQRCCQIAHEARTTV
jgi:2-dehydro-3-deoxyphosphogluconate aldolase/(4S)-4-hydroxy-2-oxoglutarate aldolase